MIHQIFDSRGFIEDTFNSIVRGIYYQQTTAGYVAVIVHLTLTSSNILVLSHIDNVIHLTHNQQKYLFIKNVGRCLSFTFKVDRYIGYVIEAMHS